MKKENTYDDPEPEDFEFDEDYYEDLKEMEIENRLSECTCGAYQLNSKGELIMVADCCC